MRVALYQEGNLWCAPDVIKIFRSLEVAMKHIPKGYELKTGPYAAPGAYAVNEGLERWVTIDEYQVIDAHDIGRE